MSDNDNTAVANGSSPQFTERELQLLGWAMQSLKSGPPEIDYEKLAAYAGMGNPRSASNAWAKIKLKLMTPSPDGAVPATPKKTPRKKTAAAKQEDGEEGADATPKKTPRKRVAKKQDVDGESSPKKKATPRGKKNETVKAESDEDADTGGSPMKIDPAKEEIVEDEV
ncbi:uncharacterized protein J4E84_009475 [Alternaria hordeiaustralica]|uniref:uncharacterized protein n=1 Tax=Alternaria hordeiaustralica TaxID=1187925 RepID=UPI0020C2B60C|nr:uncharacterized protein J4E84_009475 [Alternaria hordeiaustralica]KAI4676640.1 hypothetical protein J4E84_009475 [Alternaria hordeiaustralica]